MPIYPDKRNWKYRGLLAGSFLVSGSTSQILLHYGANRTIKAIIIFKYESKKRGGKAVPLFQKGGIKLTKKICSLVLLILWMTCIFAFSAQKAEESSKLSDSVKEKVIEVVERIFPSVAEKAASPDKEGVLITLIRKSAHFAAYLILGVLALWTFSCFGVRRRYAYSFVLCVLYAASDEIHQIFVPGRAGRIFDVFIDSMGAALGLFSGFLYKKCKKCLTK